jgi:hypothetical protein
MNQPNKFYALLTIVLTFGALATGCATNPKQLQAPMEVTCINLPEPLSFTGQYGLFNVSWTTRLERGPYWSEKVDDKGTFYRAPPGGVSIKGEDGAGFPGTQATTDGGFYIPNDPNEPIEIYRYFSTKAAPTEIPPADAICSTFGYIKDPSTSKVSLVPFAIGGAAGGAAGGIIGRNMNPGSNMSYGQAAGAGAVGGMIGGLIVGSMINADVGKIIGGLTIIDMPFMEKLREREASKETLEKTPYPVPTEKVQSSMSGPM